MRKIILTYGLIAGAIVAALMFATMPFWEDGHMDLKNGEVVGYTTMVVSLSLVFFGIKSCRDNHFKGTITFGQAFKVGILITLIASLMYAMSWEICYNTFASGFTDGMARRYVEDMKAKSSSQAEIDAAIAEMESFKEWYKNPLLRFGATIAEILPVGILITLVSSALLRKKNILPAVTSSTQN